MIKSTRINSFMIMNTCTRIDLRPYKGCTNLHIIRSTRSLIETMMPSHKHEKKDLNDDNSPWYIPNLGRPPNWVYPTWEFVGASSRIEPLHERPRWLPPTTKGNHLAIEPHIWRKTSMQPTVHGLQLRYRNNGEARSSSPHMVSAFILESSSQ